MKAFPYRSPNATRANDASHKNRHSAFAVSSGPRRVAVWPGIVLIIAALTLSAAIAAPEPSGSIATEAPLPALASMRAAEFEAAVKEAMPLPVLRILHWKELGRNRFVVEMSLAEIAGAPSPAMHVVFHTSANSDRAEILEAIAAAAHYARDYVARLPLSPGSKH